jgi:hypothetical protein
MEEDKQVRYMAVGLGMCGITVSNYEAEIIMKATDAINKMGGDFDLMTVAKIRTETEEKYKPKSVPSITIDELEKFFDDSVDQFHTRSETDPLSVNMILDALKTLIEKNRSIPI